MRLMANEIIKVRKNKDIISRLQQSHVNLAQILRQRHIFPRFAIMLGNNSHAMFLHCWIPNSLRNFVIYPNLIQNAFNLSRVFALFHSWIVWEALPRRILK